MKFRAGIGNALVLLSLQSLDVCQGLAPQEPISRRSSLGWITGAAAAAVVAAGTAEDTRNVAWAAPGADTIPDAFDVENYLKTGFVSNPMGVSGQAGKSRPETGVILRDGSEVNRDPRSGEVAAEILVKSSSSSEAGGNGKEKMLPVLASFSSPWPLATGTVFDVECRDPNTGDGAFLAVSDDTQGQSITELPDSFFVNALFSPTGRFSLYGAPTDIKVKGSSSTSGNCNYRTVDLSFSTLSQSTQTEIPRRARLVATIPEGTRQAVMLVGSASALRWKKGSDKQIASVMDTFRAIPAPQTSLKVRAKERRTW